MIDFKPDGDLMRYLVELFYQGAHYIGLVIVAVLGSTAKYISNLKRGRRLFNLAELLGEWFISGFSALMIALLCEHLGLSWGLTVVMCGIAGHMGGQAIWVLEQGLCKYLKRRFPQIYTDIKKDISDE